ncbi:MAG: glucose-6-phosphate isomerase family protein [Eubacteriales bacterium]|nr:glucose-6-phosphate isomerase family protein [Eubacteriales bacterium]MDD4717464.1 glucose-6-phosphate isomerase family protein [Eubacteriales bacterium]
MTEHDFTLPFTIDFDMVTGLSGKTPSTRRMLSQMKGMYADREAFEDMLQKEDVLIYEFYELGLPEDSGDIAFGTSIVYPGKVGSEYFMTKGHFHTIIDTGEVYYCLSGQGLMLMEDPEGNTAAAELKKGCAVYCPKRYAHRSVNTGNEPLVTFFAFRGDAGHDYGTIETKGFRKLALEIGGKPVVTDNPAWSGTEGVRGAE